MRPPLLLTAALLLAPIGRAAAESLNPDRWNTVEGTEGGASSMKGDQTTNNFGNPANPNSRVRTLNVNASVLALLPLSDAYTLNAGAGGNWSETDTAGGSNAADTDDATYQLGVQHYFEGAYSPTWRGSDNPDRWTSMGLNYSGLHTLSHSASNSAGGIQQDQGSFNSTLTANVRIPVDTAWTVLASLSGIDNYSKLEPTTTGNGSKTVTDQISASAGFRRYLVGKNLIMEDAELNPDKWTMISLILSGGDTVHSRQTLITPGGAVIGQRAIQSHFYTANVSTRIPITDHMSLAFSLSGTYTRTFTPTLVVGAGNLSRVTTINYTGSLRYFIF